MEKKINKLLLQYTVKNETIDKIVNKCESENSKIIEIIGPTGTGKTYIFEKVKARFKEMGKEFTVYTPKVFHFNQLSNILYAITDITSDEYEKMVREARQHSLNNKYDFFYFITEQLQKADKLKSGIFLIDNCAIFDQYSKDFLQYLIEYALDKKIFFITFCAESNFLFSDVIEAAYPHKEDIQSILSNLFMNEEVDNPEHGEVLLSITHGNLFLIEYILNKFYSKGKKSEFDLSQYLDMKISVHTVYQEIIDNLSDEDIDIAAYIFLLDGKATGSNLSLLTKSKNIISSVKRLTDSGLLRAIDDNLYIMKPNLFKMTYKDFSKTRQKKFIDDVIAKKDKFEIKDAQVAYYHFFIDELKLNFMEKIIAYLSVIEDHETLHSIYTSLKKNEEDEITLIKIMLALGTTNTKLYQVESSAENYRNALRLCTKLHQPVDEIVYLLAESLYKINSISFAMEIIKKYTTKTASAFWLCKLFILQADLYIIQGKIDEAMYSIETAADHAYVVKEEKKRVQLLAGCKKTKGKIYYYSNQWDKAETEFFNAEEMYKKSGEKSGLAAIYNNLGILAMYKGEWDKTEDLYKESLKLEQESYNIGGVSVCYNNLGGMFEEKGDYKQSLDYLFKALHIQKLLSDRDNITDIYNNIGITYMDNAEFDKAADAFEKSLQTAMNFSLFRDIISALNNLGALYFKSGKWTKAIEYYERAIEKSKNNSFLPGMAESYNNLGDLFSKRGEYNLSYDLYFKAEELLPDIQNDILKAELYGNIGYVLTKLHKYGEAYAYLVDSYDYFKSINAKDKLMIEVCHKQANYFIATRNFEIARYYLKNAFEISEEMGFKVELGNTYYHMSMLEKNLKDKKNLLGKAIEIYVETNSNFELAVCNIEYASVMYEQQDWEQALQLLTDNKKLIKEYDAIKLLEKNDTLIQRIQREHAAELKESKNQESLLNKFYDITQKLNLINDFDLLLDSALDNLVDISDADGGLLCLYNARQTKDSWEYQVFNKFSREDPDYDVLADRILATFSEMKGYNIKQPHFAPQFNNIITFPLVIRNQNLGVILLFSKHGSHYFNKKIYNLLSALSNQIIVLVENIRHNNLTRSHAILREELSTANTYTNIIGKSEKIQEIFRLIEKIKDTPTTIFLEGPSGTGKELITRAIHYTSNRRNKQFIAQYCGALPETLLESELFGHTKGSFTGAAYDKKGLFEVADGGTFFLDEIADISLSTQAKLLRFLQEGEVKRVGSTQTTKVNVRVICATNVSLADKVKEGKFRMDLYYRLNVIKIQVPALKERKSDIPLLAIHFLDKYNKKMNKNVLGITDEAMKHLVACNWPGNIRQLENEIERAVTLVENEAFIKPSDLSEEIFKYAENSEVVTMLNTLTLKEAVENLERKMIMDVLEKREWNQTQAAKDLGLSRQGLIKKIKRYELEKL